MCLGQYGTIVDVIDIGRAVVRFDDDTTRQVSLAVLVAEGTPVVPGDRVMVSIGMALRIETGRPDTVVAHMAETASDSSPTGQEVAR